MKTDLEHTAVDRVLHAEELRALIAREKETLVTLFLSNASITELASQYRLIDELNGQMRQYKS